jgi:hypothetical protein
MTSDLLSLREKIETAAERLGATRASIFKWRSRGVPSDWRLKLLADPTANFSIEDFEKIGGIKSKKREKPSPFKQGAVP